MQSFKQVIEKIYTSDYVLNKDGRKVHRKELIDKESGDDVKKEGYYGGKYRSAAWHADGGANDERHDLDTPRSKPADQPHAVHINGKKWKSFGSQSHAQNVAKKIKGATVHKEEVELDEESTEYEKAEENKRSADAAKKYGNMFDHHLHMADHHENLARWHASRGRHGEADKHSEKADAHHEKAMSLKEAKDKGEYDYEGEMAVTQLKTICRHAEALQAKMKPDTNLPEWVQSKITLATDYMQTAHDYLMSELEEEKGDYMLGFKDLVEKMNLAKADMGDVIKDFQQSDAPQFAGKSDEKKRQMAIAAKLQAVDGVKEELKGNQHKID